MNADCSVWRDGFSWPVERRFLGVQPLGMPPEAARAAVPNEFVWARCAWRYRLSRNLSAFIRVIRVL